MRRQCKGANRSGAPVQRWKGEVRGQRTEYGLRSAGGARVRQLGWHAVPTLPEAERNGEPGSRILEGGRTDVAWRTDATQSRPYLKVE